MAVRANWSPQRGVTRYRFQLARDREFNDVLIDRVVVGTEYEATELASGEYFWRVAPLGPEIGMFSVGRPVQAFARSQPKSEQSEARPPSTRPLRAAPAAPDKPAASLVTQTPAGSEGAGWHTLIGNVAYSVPAHLRSPAEQDIVAFNNQDVLFALDGSNGVTLWATRADSGPRSGAAKTARSQFFPIVIPSRSGRDNVLVAFDGGLRALAGATGREIWRVSLPNRVTSAAAIGLANGSSAIFAVDNDGKRLLVLDGNSGKTLAQSPLSSRAFGAPAPVADRGILGVLVAFEDGRIELRDTGANIVKSGSANSPVTTPPLFVNAPRPLVLIGTRGGLIALDAEDLHGLGRLALNDDTPRGTLGAVDLDRDGVPEVIMLTERGRVMAINAADGKIRWNVSAANDAEAPAFADVNGDGIPDVIVAAGQSFAMALSGRDGSVIWKSVEKAELASHAGPLLARVLTTSSNGYTVRIAGADSSGTGIRAVEIAVPAILPRNR
jgi:outer membrane protein assembly factor BamB